MSLQGWARYDLQFYVSDEIHGDDARDVADLIARLAGIADWTLGAPRLVDQVTPPEDDGDEPVRTLGGVLTIYQPTHDGAALDPSIDRAHLEEVSVLVAALEEYSRVSGHELELQLDGRYVGDVVAGTAGKTLTTGLLDQWRRALE